MANDIRELSMDQLEIVSGGLAGIRALIAVTMAKTDDTNNGAMDGATKDGPHKPR